MKQNTYNNLLLTISILLVLSFSCKNDPSGPDETKTRTYLMGFQNSAPRYELPLVLQTLHIWEQRADAAIISTEVPWDSLLNGEPVGKYVAENYKELVNYYRTRNFRLWVYIDPANGLNRASDATALISRGKSISQPAMQSVYRSFVFAMDSILKPEHLGLALETNAIRDISPDSVYQGIKTAANASALEIRAFDSKVKLSVSVQVDYAWSVEPSAPYRAIRADLSDFPFVEELGLSSYPYFVFDKPGDIPLNYYSVLLTEKSLPVFISEIGWPSVSVDEISSSPEKQRDNFLRQAALLDEVKAIGLFQLTFTDIDLSSFPPGYPSNLYLFASLGLVDIGLNPKPSLEAWDSIFNRKYTNTKK
jgi:hypothetical protein